MIKTVEIWNFESYENVVFDLSSGMTIICGDSDVGKSAFLRALRLVFFNEFDQRSVRVGNDSCRVKVITDRGWIDVERGKNINQWIAWKPDLKEPEKYVKIGRGNKVIPPLISEIAGINIVSLGNIDVPVNVMRQDEAHFLLSEIGNKDVSGSVRAQVIDEISGLHKAENIIRAISLDRSRLASDIKSDTAAIEEIKEKMHDEESLEAEQAIIDSAKIHLQKHTDKIKLSTEVNSTWKVYHEAYDNLKRIDYEITQLPDSDAVVSIIDGIEGVVDRIVDIEHYLKISKESEKVIAREIPDEAIGVDDCLKRVAEISADYHFIEECQKDINRIKKEIESQVSVFKDLDISAGEVKKEEEVVLSSMSVCPVVNKLITGRCVLNG
tara:strand:- start:3651 stop:4796 length:1146 start_codon:yes stop_codon:yes gene_type:complete